MTVIIALVSCGSPEETKPTQQVAPSLSRGQGQPFGPADAIVDCNGGGDFTTISAAIAAATAGDVIEVWPCTYQERINFGGRDLWIKSRDGSATTIIDAENQGTAVTVESGEGDMTGLVGFTLRRASTQAVHVDLSAIHLRDIAIRDSDASYGILSASADLELDQVSIDASNDFSVAGVYADRGSLVVHASDIDCAGANIGVFSGHGACLIDWSELTCTNGGSYAFDNEHTVGRLMRTILRGDFFMLSEDDKPDDGMFVLGNIIDGDVDVEYGTIDLVNNVIQGQLNLTLATLPAIHNNVFLGQACYISTDTLETYPTNNNFFNGDSSCGYVDYVGADGNIAEEPGFVNPMAFDFTLAADSPMIDAGLNDPFWADVDGSRADIGAYGSRYSIGGGW